MQSLRSFGPCSPSSSIIDIVRYMRVVFDHCTSPERLGSHNEEVLQKVRKAFALLVGDHTGNAVSFGSPGSVQNVLVTRKLAEVAEWTKEDFGTEAAVANMRTADCEVGLWGGGGSMANMRTADCEVGMEEGGGLWDGSCGSMANMRTADCEVRFQDIQQEAKL